jgi:hypothetical protein
MSETALRDLNTIPGSEKKNASSSKGNITKPYVGNANENLEECQKKDSVSLVSPQINGTETAKSGVETGNPEVEYIESENLNDLEDVDTSLKVFFFVSLVRVVSLLIFSSHGVLFKLFLLDDHLWTF